MMILRRRWEYWVCAVALCKLGAYHHPGVVAAHEEGHRVPRQLCAGEDGRCAWTMTTWCDADGGGAARIAVPLRTASSWRASAPGWTPFDELIVGRVRRVRAPVRRGRRHEQGHHAHLLHVGHHRHGEGCVPQLRASAWDTSSPRKYWQQVRGGHAAHERDRLAAGLSSAGARSTASGSAGAAIFAYDMDKFVPTKLSAEDAGLPSSPPSARRPRCTASCCRRTWRSLRPVAAVQNFAHRGRAAQRRGDHRSGSGSRA